jgi:hypothetical protein
MWSTPTIYVEYNKDLCGVHWRFMWSTLEIYVEYTDGLFNEAVSMSDHIT